MGRQLVHVAAERVNKVEALGRNTLDHLLDDVVAIRVLDTLHHMLVELFHEGGLLLLGNILNRLLYHTASVHLQ